MKKTCKLCWGINIILVLALVYAGYIFTVRGNVVKGEDGRTAVLMSGKDRVRVLGEMRVFLETVQSITEAAAQGDMKTVEKIARANGSVKAGGESPEFIASLPLEFKTLGMGAHDNFDKLADLAATNPKPTVLLAALSDDMLTCTACHQSYLLKATQ